MPFMVISRFAEVIDLWNIKNEIGLCLKILDSETPQDISQEFIITLAVAEDRRNTYHPGVDPISIIRALLSIARQNGMQGASTLEQQFVRVATGSYEVKIQRKLKEQALAIAIARQRSKVDIATAYLSIANYGYGLHGLSGLKTLCGNNLGDCSKQKIRESIARLKYPEPLHPTDFWQLKLANRSDYILNRMPRVNNKTVCKSSGL